MRRSVLAILLLTLQGYHAQPNTTIPSAVVTTAPTTITPPPTGTPVVTPIPTTTPVPSTASPTPTPTTAPPSSPPPKTTTTPHPTTTKKASATIAPTTTTTTRSPDPTTTTPPPPSTTVTTPSPSSDSSTMTPTPPPPSMPATIASPDVIIIDPSAGDVAIPEVTPSFPGTVDQPRATTPSHVSTASTESGGSNTVGWVMTIAAIVVGIGLLLGAVWLVRRRQQEEDDYDDFDDSFSEKDAQSHPSTTDDDSRPAANVPGAVEASAAQIEKDSMFFTWRSPSRKSQMPVVTALMPTCEDEDDVAPIVARCPSDELTLQNEVPDIFLTGESSSSFASYQYTQRGNQGTERRPAPHLDARTKDSDHDLSYSRSPRHSHNHSVMENDDNDSYAGNYNNSMSFRSAASSNASGLYMQSESDYSPRSVQDSSATDRLSNYQL